ncbi:MAG: GGDEF domain-containing protein [Actinomycetota bacterium]
MKATPRETYKLWTVAGLLFVGAYFLASGGVQDLMSPALALVAAATIVITSLRFSGTLRLAWMVIGVAFLQSAIGDGLWTLNEVVWEIEPFPSFADVFYLAFYPLLAAGLVFLVRWHRVGDRDSVVDASIVAIGAGVLAWAFIMSPYVFDSSMTLLERLVSLAYPVGDLLLLAVLVRLVFAPGKFSASSTMLALGIFTTLIADAGFAVTALQGTYATGHALDAGWLLTYVLAGAAVVHPSTTQLPAQATTDVSTLPSQRLAVLAVASMMSPAVLVIEGVRDTQVDHVVMGACSVTLFLLVLSRMAGLVRQVQAQADKLEELSDTDELTRAPNRRVWFRQIPYEIARARRSGRPLSIAMIDLDHFKAYNDAYGHQEGDRLLQEAVGGWRSQLRAGDLLVRFGGDEFIALLPDCDLEDGERAMERLRAATPFNQTCSTGVACLSDEESADELLARADRALYAAKGGRSLEKTMKATGFVSKSALVDSSPTSYPS